MVGALATATAASLGGQALGFLLSGDGGFSRVSGSAGCKHERPARPPVHAGIFNTDASWVATKAHEWMLAYPPGHRLYCVFLLSRLYLDPAESSLDKDYLHDDD